MDIIKKLIVLSAVFMCSIQAEFEAKAPTDYKEEAKNSFGSLIKGDRKNIVFGERFSSDADKKLQSNNADDIKTEKATKDLSKKDEFWRAVLFVLKDFPISFMDKKTWKIETENVKIEQFDSTGTCNYKVRVLILSNKDIEVKVFSDEDSQIRLKKHAEVIKSKILAQLDTNVDS
jgi:hypothetical protein